MEIFHFLNWVFFGIPLMWLAWFWISRNGLTLLFFILTLAVYSIYVNVTADLFRAGRDVLQIALVAQFLSLSFTIGFVPVVSRQIRASRQQQEQLRRKQPAEFTEEGEGFDAACLNIYTSTEAELLKLEEIGPVRARKIQQFLAQNKQFESFDHLAEYLGLRDFERARLQEIIEITPATPRKESTKPEPQGRIIDI